MLVQQECTALKGRSRPSGLNDDECGKIILSKSFGESLNGFCSVLANESKKNICTEKCWPASIEA